jgi:antitoxin (DNA-binding transcriptional repressor) of toxin-antitoxin stability system
MHPPLGYIMVQSITLSEMLSNPAELLERVMADQVTLILTDDNRAVAEIKPVLQPDSPETIAAKLASLPHLPPDEAEAFARDIEEGRLWLSRMPVRNLWED